MADTKHSTAVQVSRIFVDFFKTKTETRGTLRNQAEQAMLGNPEFKKDLQEYAKSKGVNL